MDTEPTNPRNPVQYKVEVDNEGYVKSFSLQERENYLEFFKTHDFVVVNGVLSSADCEETIKDIWDYVEKRVPSISRADPSTWNDKWHSTGLYSEGIIGYDAIFSTRALKNRQNPNLIQVCTDILGTTNVLVNHDRYGLFRPTNDPKIGSNPHWMTIRNCHLDMNPWQYVSGAPDDNTDEKVVNGLSYNLCQHFITENNFVPCLAKGKTNIQGLINLKDNKVQDGGFQIVPGFGHHIKEWANATPDLSKKYGTRETFIMLPTTETVCRNAQRISCRAGSVVIWNQNTIHGSAPNDSAVPRYAQFIKVFEKPTNQEQRLKRRREKLLKIISELNFQTELTDLGRKVFDLQEDKPDRKSVV